MADNGFKINKSVNFNPQAGAPANPVDGDFYYDATAQTFAYYHNGSWANFDSVGTVTAQEWMTSAQFTPAIVRNSVIKVTGGTDVDHLAGISASFSAKRITVYNAGADTIVVEPEDAMEPTANNRIMTPTGGSMNLVAGEVAVFTYDIVASRWLLVSISSQGGAQVIATTSNPGLVTLHQASLLPLDGVVLSDGDLNTATGVVGLDANKAATITAPTAAVAALTLDAHASAEALILNGSAGAPVFRITNPSDAFDCTIGVSDVHIDRRKLHFSNDDGFSNTLDNYMQYTTVASTGTRGVKVVNETALDTGTIEFEHTNDGFGGIRADIRLTATATTQTISAQQGNLNLNFLEVGSTKVGFGAAGTFSVSSNSTVLWEVTGSGASPAGALQGVGGNRFVRNVSDPTLAQDAATKAYVDRQSGALNMIINGNFDFWQRGAAIKNLAGCNKTATHAAAANTYDIRYGADRWYGEVTDLSGAASGNTCSLTRQASGLNTSPYCCRVTGVGAGGGSQLSFGMTQEIDRDIIPQIRGKTLIVQFKIRADATYIANGGNTQIRVTGGTDAGGNVIRRNYAGSTAVLGVQTISNATLTGSFQTFTYVSDAVPTNCTELALNFSGGGTGAVTHYFEIAEVMVFAGLTTVPDYFVRHGGSYEAELMACQRFYEKSYEVNTTPGTSGGSLGTDGTFVSFWPSAVATTATVIMPITHPRFLVKKWAPLASTSPVTLYRRDAADTVGSWLITGGTSHDVTAAGAVSQCGFIVFADESLAAVGAASDQRTIDGHWACSADIGDSV